MKCPRCGAEENGAFCSKCGTDLAAVSKCRRCGGELTAGARYCIRCGARVRGSHALRWVIPAAVAVLALAAGYWLGGRDETSPGTVALTPAARPTAGMAGSPPPLTGSLREQADRLFERIMQARARGDTAEARFFLPMALQAYGGVEELDADGLFHLGLLQLGGGMTADAAATARRIDEASPGHLFGFALRADAAMEEGNRQAAAAAYSEFLDRYDAEMARGLSEYELHRPALEEYREHAREITGD